ncbi:hypothetical protein FRC03_010549 [Tulasnella sp. 419]|nr:hypothetical protein FRC03_010549 [Tulasnella sp. 419]
MNNPQSLDFVYVKSPEEEARLLTELEELLRRLPASLPDPKTGHQTTYHFGLDPDALEDLGIEGL